MIKHILTVVITVMTFTGVGFNAGSQGIPEKSAEAIYPQPLVIEEPMIIEVNHDLLVSNIVSLVSNFDKEDLVKNATDNMHNEIVMIAKTMYGEARGVSDGQMEAVGWCIMNRVDDSRFPDNISDVVTSPDQFVGYSYYHPVEDHIYDIAYDVVYNYNSMKYGLEYERNLPEGYLFFGAGVGVNLFRREYNDSPDWW